ncbi:MAG: ATP-binding cassette domain-containing protein, partial [Eubacteriales bacterium]
VAVIGGNGAGKSTFVESVTGLIPTEGKVSIGGMNLPSSERVRKSYIVMQDVNRQLFCPSVEEELSLNSSKTPEEIQALLEQMDIAQTKTRHPASLSGGQKQRVAICSAFSAKKELMCYDEPTSGLDFTGMKNFCNLVSQTCDRHTLTLIITHDLELVLGCCTHVVHLEQGEVVDSYPVDDLGVEKLKHFFLHQKQSVKYKEKKEKQSVLKQLLSYNKAQKPIFLLGLGLSGISSVLSLLPIVMVWLGVSDLFHMYPNFTVTKELGNYAYLAVGTAIATILVYGMALLCTHIVAFRIGKNLKKSVISRLLDLPLGYFDATGSGKIRRTLSETIGKTEGYLAHQMPDMIGAMVTPVAVICFGFYFNWQLGLLSLVPLVLAAYVMGLTMGDEVAESMAQYQSSLEEMNNEAVEFVRGISVIKTFGQSIFSLKKFHETVLRYKEQVIGYTEFFRKPMVLFQTLLASVSSVLLISGLILFTNTQNLDKFFLDFLFFLFFTPLYGTMMMRLMWMSQNTQAAADSLNRISDLLDVEDLAYPENCSTPDSYDIKLENVSFSYPNSGKNALTQVNMELKTGQTVALVGGSGGGKSTLAMLIPRFWDVGEGRITIGGVDVRDMSEETLMNLISFVFQNTKLYQMTILDNVREGKLNTTEAEVLRALKLARCEDIIAKLPQGINTMIGAEGVYLSGGEAQRIAIARAILKDAPILLLDEATAFTDPENEHEIQLAMNELAKNKTVLMIAHRLSSVVNADSIYLIQDGRLMEHGTQSQLLEQKGRYAEMWAEYNRAFMWKEERK